MHYVWLNRLFPQNNLTTVDGRRLRIINPGTLNNDAGPDFFNATVMIDNETWAGNVEMHLRASDWHRHNHTHDPAYQTVILHVVEHDDAQIYRSSGGVIPQFVMRCSPDISAHFHSLADFSVDTLPCVHALRTMPAVYLTDWLTALGHERIYNKADRVAAYAADNGNDWIEAGYIAIARALGFGINSEPFERLARATPLHMLRHHADDCFIIESILLGQAGLLPEEGERDAQMQRMAAEYDFFAAKFGMKPPAGLAWKFSRTRPQNSPQRRIRILAGFISDPRDFIGNALSINSLERLNAFYDEIKGLGLSRSSFSLLFINAIVPLIYAFANFLGDYTCARDIMEVMHEVAPESNRFTAMFSMAGVKIDSAFVSQAVVQLRREYCEKRKCLYCRIGHRYLCARALR